MKMIDGFRKQNLTRKNRKNEANKFYTFLDFTLIPPKNPAE